jgi:transposase
VLVDAQGWLIAQDVAAADTPDGEGGREPVEEARREHPRLSHLWLDAGFGPTFVEWVRTWIGWTVEVVTKVAGQVGFRAQPRRWAVERTLAWLGEHRRLSEEYDQLEESTEAWIYLATIGLMARRITRLVN